MATYELIEHDEMDLALCIYEYIRECLLRGDEVKLRPLAIHCNVHIADLQDRIKIIEIIRLRTMLEMEMDED